MSAWEEIFMRTIPRQELFLIWQDRRQDLMYVVYALKKMMI